MTRFFFDLYDGRQCHEDQNGCELPDLQAAQAIAEHSVRTLCEEERGSGQTCSGCGIIIGNEAREPLLIVPFDDERPWGH